MKLRTVYWRSLRLRCPRCGEGELFRGWFQMRGRCVVCEFSFDRGPGFYLGSIYVNYGLTAILLTALYFSLYFSGAVSPNAALCICLAFCILFPIWFFRYARSLWLGMDCYLDPSGDPPMNSRDGLPRDSSSRKTHGKCAGPSPAGYKNDSTAL